jgi:6-phospho-3-hexuloisomerase
MGQFRHYGDLIIDEVRQALGAVQEEQVDALAQEILAAEKIFAIGVGRVMLSLQAIVKRLNHLGLRAWCVGEVNEPAITERDLLIVASGSGESVIPLGIAGAARKHGARIAHIGSSPASSLSPLVDLFVRVPVRTRLRRPDEIPSAQIMTSLFEQSLLILGDALSLILRDRLAIEDLDSLWRFHANLE